VIFPMFEIRRCVEMCILLEIEIIRQSLPFRIYIRGQDMMNLVNVFKQYRQWCKADINEFIRYPIHIGNS